jgi:ribonuclease P protein component
VQRLKTRAQFEAAMAGGTLSRTAHFVLHRKVPASPSAPAGPGSVGPQALFAVHEASIGAVVPKRWAKRAVTRNGIKRQIYNVSAAFEPKLAHAPHVVRLRMAFDRKAFVSAWSDALKAEVRGELLQLFERAPMDPGMRRDDKSLGAGDKAAVIPAQAGIHGSEP